MLCKAKPSGRGFSTDWIGFTTSGVNMSKIGRQIAIHHGEKLPAFSSWEEAQRELFAFRDHRLALLARISEGHPQFELNYRPESLKGLEQWYFHLYETDSFAQVGATREIFETCMAMYFSQTAVQSANARWIVEEYFLTPGRYQLGVRKDLITIIISRFSDYFREPNNKRRQSLLRMYTKYLSK